MRSKIYYRSTNLWNILLFIVISLFYFLIQEVAYTSVSILNKEFIVQTLQSHPLVFILFGLLSLLVYNLKPISKYFFVAYITLQLFLIIMNLTNDFSKLIVVTTGVELIFSYYFFNFLASELDAAAYRSNLKKNNLFDNSWKKIVVYAQKQEVGYICNWDEDSFNVVWSSKLNPQEVNKLCLSFESKTFEAEVKCSCSDNSSAGFFIKEPLDNSFRGFNWADLYGILSNMGFQTGYVQ